MEKTLWKPHNKKQSQMYDFLNQMNAKYNLEITNYNELHKWSVENISVFWKEIWNYSKIIYSRPYTKVVKDLDNMIDSKWFLDSRLNFAENLLQFKDDKIAIYYKNEDNELCNLSYADLYIKVEMLSHSLKERGVKENDRVVGYLPNIPETIIAMLATTSIGAIWSSCSPDFGVKGVLDRFQQIDPKILFVSNGYQFKGKQFDLSGKISKIIKGLPSLKGTIIIKNIKTNSLPQLNEDAIDFNNFMAKDPDPLTFAQLPFDHPLYIMYSSGTTGIPKSIVHSSGGTLIQHKKELQLHCNLKREDCIFYFTTCGWMMWNWLVSSLSVGASIVLYDGSPFYPNNYILWKLAEKVNISIFGTSAKYLELCKKNNLKPITETNLSSLKTILSTGSTLAEESFDFVYKNVKQDVLLGSISGGTDIISCFALSNPILPVKRGEIQCLGLGMNVKSYNKNGKSLINEKGELVCTSAFPSMPIYFWNDKHKKKYHDTYFNKYKQVWNHGDYISILSSGSLKIYGRSDATLNPGGVRIGTSEIYRIVSEIDFIKDSIIIGQNWRGDQRIILFIELNDKKELNTSMKEEIRIRIKQNSSPKHVPSKIIPVKGIPYTISGKKVELAVKKIVEGKRIDNKDSLQNPLTLEYFKNIQELNI